MRDESWCAEINLYFSAVCQQHSQITAISYLHPMYLKLTMTSLKPRSNKCDEGLRHCGTTA